MQIHAPKYATDRESVSFKYKDKDKTMTEYTTQGISVTTQCYDCMQLDDVCDNCLELREARDSAVAHQLVDEGNLQYSSPWSWLKDMPSGHDWTNRDGEYKLPIVQLQDGGEYEELWELDDERQRAREVQCPWCNILTPKTFNDCQDCDKPLELNVR